MSRDLEKRIRQTGLWLYQLIEGETPSIFRKDFWTGKVMEWCMQNEAFKVEMFRFVDVFPYLTRPESVAKHLQEYFCRPDQCFPMALQWGLRQLSPTSMAAKMVARSMAKNIANMGLQFIAGADAREALPVLEKMRAQGLAFTADLLGEAVVSREEEEAYLERYLDLFDVLGTAARSWKALGDGAGDLDWGWAPKLNVSIKPSAMYSQMNACAFDYSVDRAKDRLRPLFRKAMELGAFVCLDMEHTALKNITLALYKSLMEEPEFRGYPHTGVVIQAYLRDSEADLRDLIDWARKNRQPCTVRLVKGAYWDAEVIWARQNHWPVPVYTNKYDTDANFEKLARLLMENSAHVGFACASHNIRSLAYVIELSKDLKVPEDRIEYQILYGMAEPVRTALKKAGLPLRLYTPIGEMIPGMAYLVRRLLENTSNESFLRLSFSEGVSREELLRNPVELAAEHPEPQRPPRSAPEYGDKGPFVNEPPWDWTIAEVRRTFERTLAKLPKDFPVQVPLVINGKKVRTRETFSSTNPNRTDQVVGVVASAGEEEALQAVAAAKDAFDAWRDTPPRERAEYLFRAAQAARNRRYELAALQVYEVGKSWKEADADVCEAIDFLEYYGREMIRLGTPRRMGHVPGEVSHLFYEPRGVTAVVAPWNFPFAISVGMTSAALVTGNTVVYKPASQSPVIGYWVYRIFEEAKLPKGVLNFLPGPGGKIGDLLVTHPDVAMIAFTGSKEIGLRIIERAARTPSDAQFVKNVVAEMGGKNAIIIDADADLDEAVVQVLHSAFGYQGQKCSACSRLIVLEENYDKLLERLRAAAESLELGPVENPKNVMGAVIDARAREKILEYIEIGKREGKVLVERPVEGKNGHFVPLAIFTEIRPEHRLAQEEIFGPVLSVLKVRDFDEALEVANSTQYALTGAVFSRSPENIEKARRRFRVGNLYINRGSTGAIVERHPFGGFKMSGVGSKAGGPDYLLQFMVPRNVAENTMRRGFAPSDE
ncbi:L-proline dehydrogenase /delta-1-pyrroline-5-carboxylate dehydrogenase [Desulfacinum infernum DSM 9756]|jgi:RHH-type proline utilization regulon transcriptional repressor/proline dehydrogenase/delta 1-pyrroline-5-carboxylate dehydrogenase|uniref:L-glutamate gamma-semialdehyde dehydrogenase n=1 Tax=Desulfacinum infernum DSM 9756 TaxID=1121391 RepID=A0A1M5EHQ9_9BACT|nr:L-glutamate gamma-semialdehyde dehydrogenase [Desulfacinum infernum]SHF78779.1 L-proline dehydrogenase /delta-1-pyrroline-5-carboxylate dehydrogenase [Desulfacinum infernum DSM 9756]